MIKDFNFSGTHKQHFWGKIVQRIVMRSYGKRKLTSKLLYISNCTLEVNQRKTQKLQIINVVMKKRYISRSVCKCRKTKDK